MEGMVALTRPSVGVLLHLLQPLPAGPGILMISASLLLRLVRSPYRMTKLVFDAAACYSSGVE